MSALRLALAAPLRACEVPSKQPRLWGQRNPRRTGCDAGGIALAVISLVVCYVAFRSPALWAQARGKLHATVLARQYMQPWRATPGVTPATQRSNPSRFAQRPYETRTSSDITSGSSSSKTFRLIYGATARCRRERVETQRAGVALSFRRGCDRLVAPEGAGLEATMRSLVAWSLPQSEEDGSLLTGFRESDSAGETIRVITYNVLSDSLCDPGYFNYSRREDCDPETRLLRVQTKLEAQMREKAVLCLQEVSRKWGARLVAFFEKSGYSYTVAPYGNRFNGYMGQMLAWPRGTYELEMADIRRVAETVRGYWPPPPKVAAPTRWQRIRRFFGLWSEPKAQYDAWRETERRHNVVILVRLRCLQSGARFVVGNYHMPCLYGSDEKCQVMVAHAALMMQHAQRWANGTALIVGGDFNVRPDQPMYNMLAEGFLSRSHPQCPPSPAPFNRKWAPIVDPMRSAYALYNGREPDFTNKAWTRKSEECFEETLDYLWLSQDWDVKSVLSLPSNESVRHSRSFPTATEPSDHLMIGAELRLRS